MLNIGDKVILKKDIFNDFEGILEPYKDSVLTIKRASDGYKDAIMYILEEIADVYFFEDELIRCFDNKPCKFMCKAN